MVSPAFFEALETQRLVPRLVEPGDAEAIAAMMTPAVSCWVASWPVPFTVDMARARISEAIEAFGQSRALPLAVERRADAALLGWIGVSRPTETARRASLGFWLGETHQGQGYISEALPAVVAAAFRWFDIDVLEAGALPDNAASIRGLERIGMKPVGHRTIFAAARQRDELCLFHETERRGPIA